MLDFIKVVDSFFTELGKEQMLVLYKTAHAVTAYLWQLMNIAKAFLAPRSLFCADLQFRCGT